MRTISFQNDAAFGALFQNANLGMIIVDSSGLIRLINPFAEKLFEYNRYELTGKPVSMLLSENTRNRYAASYANYFVSPSAYSGKTMFETYAFKKNKETFPVEISISYFSAEEETLTIAFIKDISKEKKAEEKFSKLFAKARLA